MESTTRDSGILLVDAAATARDALAAACAQTCEHIAIGVIACDAQLSVLAMTPRARVLISELVGDARFGGSLPHVVQEAARAHLRSADVTGRSRLAPIRIDTADGVRPVYVASRRIEHPQPSAASLAVAVRLYEDGFANDDLFDAIRDDVALSARDRRLIVLLRRGHTNLQMADAMGVTAGTLKVYLHELYAKFDVHSRWQLLALFERIRVER